MVEGMKTDSHKQRILVEILERDATTKQLLVASVQKNERDNAARLKKSEGELAMNRSATLPELQKLRAKLRAQHAYITLELDARDDALRELNPARVATRS